MQILRCTIQSFHDHLHAITWNPFTWLLHDQLMVKQLYQVWIDRCLWVVDYRFFNFLFKVDLAFSSFQSTSTTCVLDVDFEAVVSVATTVFVLLLKVLVGWWIDTCAVERVGNNIKVCSQVAAVLRRLSRSSELDCLSSDESLLWNSEIWRIVWCNPKVFSVSIFYYIVRVFMESEQILLWGVLNQFVCHIRRLLSLII